jgi:hypothetical protein
MQPVGLARVLAAVALTLLASCTAAINVHTKQSPSADFERYRTFSFESDPRPPARFAPAPASRHVERRVERVATILLLEKGYVPKERTSDMNLRVSAGQRTREIRVPERARPAWFVEDEDEDFVEGAFVIDAFDAATGEVVWHGSARLEVDPGKVDENRLRRAVNDVLAKFPSRSGPSGGGPSGGGPSGGGPTL